MAEILNSPLVTHYGSLFMVLASLLGAVLAGLLTHSLVFRILRRVATSTKSEIDDAMVRHMTGPSRVVFPLLFVNFALPALKISSGQLGVIRHAMGLALIAAIAWVLIRLTHAASDVILARFDLAAADNLAARSMHTQLRVFRRIVTVVIVVLGVASMLMTFDRVRQLGTSILASAGILGIVVGMAAQRALSNLIAGVQIAITQPIRLDDVVIVEGEWGRIEEITFTYVVVRIWDLRRLVLPISYFIEKPFQNWTRVTADILGTVELHLDYSVPLEPLRKELKTIVEASPHWDGKVCGLQVTEATERTITARALVSAADASKAWDLRCDVREKLLSFVQRNYPTALPRVRADVERSPAE